MKITTILIVLSFLPVLLAGQQDQIKLDLETSKNETSATPVETIIRFWDEYEFTDANEYSILVAADINDSNRLYRINDIEAIKSIQDRYRRSISAFNKARYSDKQGVVFLVKEKKILDYSMIGWECNMLETKDGPIEVELDLFLADGEWVPVKTENQVFLTKHEFDEAIERALTDEATLFLNSTKEFIGKVDVVFENGVEKINQILEDEFYYDLAQRTIADYKNESTQRDLGETGALIDMMIRIKNRDVDYVLEHWRISNSNPGDYILTISYFDEAAAMNFGKEIKQWDASTYTLMLLKIKD